MNIVFQQDNARPHTAKITQRLLKELGPRALIYINAIEHMWARLKLRWYQYIRASPDAIRRVIWEWLMEVWWQIGGGVLRDLIDRMPHPVRCSRRLVHRILRYVRCLSFILKAPDLNIKRTWCNAKELEHPLCGASLLISLTKRWTHNTYYYSGIV